jgi:hypothetical protein
MVCLEHIPQGPANMPNSNNQSVTCRFPLINQLAIKKDQRKGWLGLGRNALVK